MLATAQAPRGLLRQIVVAIAGSLTAPGLALDVSRPYTQAAAHRQGAAAAVAYRHQEPIFCPLADEPRDHWSTRLNDSVFIGMHYRPSA